MPLGDELRDRHGDVDPVSDHDRRPEIERLRDVDGAGPGKRVPSTAEMRLSVYRPCAILWPKEVLAAKCSDR